MSRFISFSRFAGMARPAPLWVEFFGMPRGVTNTFVPQRRGGAEVFLVSSSQRLRVSAGESSREFLFHPPPSDLLSGESSYLAPFRQRPQSGMDIKAPIEYFLAHRLLPDCIGSLIRSHNVQATRHAMPTEYSCSSCGLRISVGSYHGSNAGVWFNALYCRHCGTPYTLRQSSAQFFEGFGAKNMERKTRKFELLGPSTNQGVVVDEDAPRPSLTCEMCKAEGPFGPKGPITDDPPEGLASERPFGGTGSNATGTCPKCKKPTMKASGSWIT